MPENSTTLIGSGRNAVRSGRVRGALDGMLLAGIDRLVGQRIAGPLHVRLPSGRSARIGRPGERSAGLEIRSYRGIARTLQRGLVGFAEAYMAGEIDTPSLPDLIEHFMVNEQALVQGVPALLRSSPADRRYHAGRANTRAGSARNIADHYDLGNAFYRLWLDAGLSYSSAIYRRPDMTLEAAQAEKHEAILAALALAPGHTLLEIGCGWGSVVEAAARAGADVTGITISREQLAETEARIARLGLGGRARARFQDYRDIAGCYDRLVAIEMIEAVGEEHWPGYFSVLRERLKPGGHAVLQAITIREDLYEDYRARPDFIQRYIFPGGMLPTVAAMQRHASSVGLEFEVVERFGASYASTLLEWRRRFHEAWSQIEALGFDTRFRRMWDYYLCYCEAGFRHGLIDVGLYRMRRPG